MKPKFSWIVALLLVSPALALEAPVDDAPPPPLLKKGRATTERSAPTVKAPEYSGEAPEVAEAAESRPAAPAVQKAAFLGLVTAEVPDLLNEHLRLKSGEGIMVRALMPDGPATKAGVTVHDVILRANGLAISTPSDLTAEISKRKVGDTLKLELIHQGQPTTVDVVLGERPPQIAASAPSHSPRRYQLQGLPQSQEEQMRQLLQQQFEDGSAETEAVQPNMDDSFRRMQQRIERLMRNAQEPEADETADSETIPAPRAESGVRTQSQATVRVMDNEGSIELKSSNDRRDLTAYDPSGKVIWQGPWTTPEDKAAAPDEVRNRVSRLHLDSNFQGKSLRFNLHPAPPDQN